MSLLNPSFDVNGSPVFASLLLAGFRLSAALWSVELLGTWHGDGGRGRGGGQQSVQSVPGPDRFAAVAPMCRAHIGTSGCATTRKRKEGGPCPSF